MKWTNLVNVYIKNDLDYPLQSIIDHSSNFLNYIVASYLVYYKKVLLKVEVGWWSMHTTT